MGQCTLSPERWTHDLRPEKCQSRDAGQNPDGAELIRRALDETRSATTHG